MPRAADSLARLIQNSLARGQVGVGEEQAITARMEAKTREKEASLSSLLGPIQAFTQLGELGLGAYNAYAEAGKTELAEQEIKHARERRAITEPREDKAYTMGARRRYLQAQFGDLKNLSERQLSKLMESKAGRYMPPEQAKLGSLDLMKDPEALKEIERRMLDNLGGKAPLPAERQGLLENEALKLFHENFNEALELLGDVPDRPLTAGGQRDLKFELSHGLSTLGAQVDNADRFMSTYFGPLDLLKESLGGGHEIGIKSALGGTDVILPEGERAGLGKAGTQTPTKEAIAAGEIVKALGKLGEGMGDQPGEVIAIDQFLLKSAAIKAGQMGDTSIQQRIGDTTYEVFGKYQYGGDKEAREVRSRLVGTKLVNSIGTSKYETNGIHIGSGGTFALERLYTRNEDPNADNTAEGRRIEKPEELTDLVSMLEGLATASYRLSGNGLKVIPAILRSSLKNKDGSVMSSTDMDARLEVLYSRLDEIKSGSSSGPGGGNFHDNLLAQSGLTKADITRAQVFTRSLQKWSKARLAEKGTGRTALSATTEKAMAQEFYIDEQLKDFPTTALEWTGGETGDDRSNTGVTGRGFKFAVYNAAFMDPTDKGWAGDFDSPVAGSLSGASNRGRGWAPIRAWALDGEVVTHNQHRAFEQGVSSDKVGFKWKDNAAATLIKMASSSSAASNKKVFSSETIRQLVNSAHNPSTSVEAERGSLFGLEKARKVQTAKMKKQPNRAALDKYNETYFLTGEFPTSDNEWVNSTLDEIDLFAKGLGFQDRDGGERNTGTGMGPVTDLTFVGLTSAYHAAVKDATSVLIPDKKAKARVVILERMILNNVSWPRSWLEAVRQK